MRKFVEKALSRLRYYKYDDWLEVLGRDLFVLCVAKLDYITILSCARVCKAWNEVVTDNVIWTPMLSLEFKADAFGITITTSGQALKEYKRCHINRLQQEREWAKERERMEKEAREMEMRSRMDRMVCRMFHPSNGRDNFVPFSPTVPFAQMPDRDTLIKILARDNELRLSKDIQTEYWAADFPSAVTLKVQTQAVKEYGYEDPWIIPSAISYYKDDPELMSIPHYVKYNRSQPGKVQVGDSVPDLPLTNMQGCATSLMKELSPHSSLPIVLVAGSYT
jgi:hypothetical protein